MQDLIAKLQGKSVHVVGVTGAEGSSILRFLVKHNISNITTHDFSKTGEIEKNFKLWHKGLSISDKRKLFQQFQSDLKKAGSNWGVKYLAGIENADIIFIPQSWRLYKKENLPLWKIAGKIPFYSLTRLYLDFSPAKIIAVTGTVGKGSTANIIFQLLKKAGRRVYFTGNETWMLQLADKLDEMEKDDLLILEISHRQLQDGFTRAPSVAVITNLYPNHLDEVSWSDYVSLKLALIKHQGLVDTAVLNYDVSQLRLRDKLKSKAIYFSEKVREMNTKSIQLVYNQLLSNKSNQYPSNLLAGMTVGELLGLNPGKMIGQIGKIAPLTARLELIRTINGVNIYDDIKSTTPWATLAALNKLGKETILICGGRAKGIDYKEFTDEIKKSVKYAILLKSEMSRLVKELLPDELYEEVETLAQALDTACTKAVNTDNILVSPAAGFFYSDFIKGKNSLKKLVTSLPLKEQV